jgi:membrane-associated phospholipid phosphatase
MADFWSDDVRGLTFSPPDRWISIALQLIDQHQSDFKTAIELLAKLGIGLNDAVTLCWKYKYTYSLERPQTIIRTHMDSLWQPYHENPDFPSYPSGHAVIGSTASAILINYFGDQISFTDRTHESRIEFMGKPRHYLSITSMEKENAWSRIYMGVHYPSDCSEGMRLGREVGRRVNQLNLKHYF